MTDPIVIFDDISFELSKESTILLRRKRWAEWLSRKDKETKTLISAGCLTKNEARIIVSSHCFICGKGWRFHPQKTYADHSKRSYE